MSGSAFYDDLAADYHLLFDDWYEAVRRQGTVLHRLLGGGQLRILDVSCGIGTQSLGLAALGHAVTGRDASPASVTRARREANTLGVPATFEVGDMRERRAEDRERFDVVLSMDNALPHLESPEELLAAFSAARAALERGGRFFASIRDYGSLATTRPAFTEPRTLTGTAGERIVFQRWAWDADCTGYRFEQFILVRRNDCWETRTYSGRYRALLRSDLAAALREAGFRSIEWLEPAVSGFYQPIVVAA